MITLPDSIRSSFRRVSDADRTLTEPPRENLPMTQQIRLLTAIDAGTGRPASRRGFLSGAAKLAGGGALALSGLTLAAGRGLAAPSTDFAGDLDVLGFLLAIEQTEAALYDDFIARFGMDETTSGDRPLPFYPEIHKLRAHEYQHVQALAEALVLAGGEPIAADGAAFAYADEADFFRLAAALESEAVGAITGALPALREPDLVAVVLGVLAADARHAAHLSLRAGGSPFPMAVEPALGRGELRLLPNRVGGRPGGSPILSVED
jgi:hypothetical protein